MNRGGGTRKFGGRYIKVTGEVNATNTLWVSVVRIMMRVMVWGWVIGVWGPITRGRMVGHMFGFVGVVCAMAKVRLATRAFWRGTVSRFRGAIARFRGSIARFWIRGMVRFWFVVSRFWRRGCIGFRSMVRFNLWWGIRCRFMIGWGHRWDIRSRYGGMIGFRSMVRFNFRWGIRCRFMVGWGHRWDIRSRCRCMIGFNLWGWWSIGSRCRSFVK